MLHSLIQRLQERDSGALEPLIEATRGMASRLAYSITQDPYRSEDVLQDVYSTVYQKVGQLGEVSAFKGWFSRIIVNRCRAELKRSADWLEEPEEDPPLPEAGDALQELSRPDRVVLVLREVMDLAYEEIAQTLNIPPNTVRSRIFQARRRLEQVMLKGRVA